MAYGAVSALLDDTATSQRLLATQPHLNVSWRHNHVSTSLGSTATFRRLLAAQPRLGISRRWPLKIV
ncbi:unnamed protein product [Sphagnum balticum]